MSTRSITYKPTGVCARSITVTVDDNDIVTSIEFVQGCDGNHKGLTAMCIGKPAAEVKEKLAGITCGFRSTSCPDQLSKALAKLMQEND